MSMHYYLLSFPMEALVASELEPIDFSGYMATGSNRGSSEPLIFIEIDEKGLKSFDLEYAKTKCAEKKGLKNSLYLSVYDVLANISPDYFGTLYLVTKDGRCLGLEPQKVTGTIPSKPFYLYQELCPLRPLVVSESDPIAFLSRMTNSDNKLYVPRLIIADIKVIDFDSLDNAGNIGDLYYQNISHLKACIEVVKTNPAKHSKTLDRTRADSFTYQIIDTGIYVGDSKQTIFYRMKTITELRVDHYAWAKSAMII